MSADDIWPAGMEDSESLVERDQGSLAVEFSNIERFQSNFLRHSRQWLKKFIY